MDLTSNPDSDNKTRGHGGVHGGTASLQQHSGCWNKGELMGDSGGKCTVIPLLCGMKTSVSQLNQWQQKHHPLQLPAESHRRGLAAGETRTGRAGAFIWRTAGLGIRDLPRKWCWNRKWSTWCSSSLHEPWNAFQKSWGWIFVSIVAASLLVGGERNHIHGAGVFDSTAYLFCGPRLDKRRHSCFSDRSATSCRAWVNKRRRRSLGGAARSFGLGGREMFELSLRKGATQILIHRTGPD